jgi:hypothetical protein
MSANTLNSHADNGFLIDPFLLHFGLRHEVSQPVPRVRIPPSPPWSLRMSPVLRSHFAFRRRQNRRERNGQGHGRLGFITTLQMQLAAPPHHTG